MGTQGCIRKETDGTGDGAAVYRPRPVVLVIDDEPGVRESLRLILKTTSRCSRRQTAPPVSSWCARARVDVALLDVRLPGERRPEVLPAHPRARRDHRGDPDDRGAGRAHGGGRHQGGRLRLHRQALRRGRDPDLLVRAGRASSGGSSARCATSGPSSIARTASTRSWAATPPWCASTRRSPRWPQTHATVLVTAGERHRQGAGGPRHPPPEPAARPALRGREPRRHSRHPARVASCSATRKGPSPGPLRASSASSSWPTAGRSSSTRSAACGWTSRPSCCARSRSARSSGSAAPAPSGGRPGDRGHQRRPAPGRPGAAPSARTSTTGSTWCRIGVPPLRERKDDIPLLVEHFIRKYSREFKKAVPRPLPRARCRRSTATTGRATCASSRTSSSAAWPWPPAR